MAQIKISAKARVVSNNRISGSYYIMALECKEIASQIRIGQFIHIRCDDGIKPFLRRPFSVYRIPSKSEFWILYKVIGEGTRLLSVKGEGDVIDVVGPCGNGFFIQPSDLSDRSSVILIGGGRGIAPLVALGEELVKMKPVSAGKRPIAIIGARSKEDILCVGDFKKIGFDVKIVTEDSSAGEGVRVTDVLDKLLRITNYELRITIYACGPNAMLRSIYGIIKGKDAECYGSFEEMITCGLGACMGCVMKIQNSKSKIQNGFEYKRVCKEGPVFNLKDIVWR